MDSCRPSSPESAEALMPPEDYRHQADSHDGCLEPLLVGGRTERQSGGCGGRDFVEHASQAEQVECLAIRLSRVLGVQGGVFELLAHVTDGVDHDGVQAGSIGTPGILCEVIAVGLQQAILNGEPGRAIPHGRSARP